MSDINDTQPHGTNDTQLNVIDAPLKRPSRWIVVLGFVLLLGLGILGGYQSGLSQRRAAQSTVVFQQLDEQYQLGIQAMNENRYEIALQHFQFVIEHDPSYLGVQEKLTEVLVKLSITPSPTASPTPAYTPTPDLRGVEEIFAHTRQLLDAQDWDGAISNLDSLRKSDPTYRAAEVDGMYYIALRMRGYEKIIPPSQLCSDINLEGGIYDLTLAERFGPLDSNAESLRTWSRYYINGASFWELDWYQAMNYFAQIYPNLPNLMDSSCMTATERYRYATLKYIDRLWMIEGDFCAAQRMYDEIFLNVPSDKNAISYPTATQVYDYCLQGGGPTPSISLTPTP
jgi:tetratricopeptide (TPR) repeat protein